MPDPFNTPSEVGGVWQPDAIKGRLVLITPLEYITDIPTKFGPTDAVRVDYVTLDGPKAPDVQESAMIWQGAIIGKLKNLVGKGRVLGRVGQGQPKPGMSPAWILTDPGDDDKKVAMEYIASESIV